MKDIQQPESQHRSIESEPSGFDSHAPAQFKSAPAFQLKAGADEGSPKQLKSSPGGLPGEMVQGFASSTGHDLSDVQVHRNSDKPEKVGALAYAQGNDIHLGVGQEQHLAHEAAHIVQQREGRVQANTNVGGMPVNDSASLESEADTMGAKALQMKSADGESTTKPSQVNRPHYTAQLKRKLREDYPWQGVVVTDSNFRRTPSRDPHNPSANVIRALPSGTRLSVKGKTSSWMNVEVSSQNGYVHESLVDDAVAHNISTEMVGEERTWYPSGPGPDISTDFVDAALDNNVPMPTIGAHAPTGAAFTAGHSGSSLNCWEMVLLAAYQVGVIDWAFLNRLYRENGVDYEQAWIGMLTSGGAKTYLPGDPNTERPASGDIVFFDNLSHVALGTGETVNGQSKVYSFWPPANITVSDLVAALAASDRSVLDRLNHGRVEVTTIETLTGWMAESDRHAQLGGSGAGNSPTVTFYSPSW